MIKLKNSIMSPDYAPDYSHGGVQAFFGGEEMIEIFGVLADVDLNPIPLAACQCYDLAARFMGDRLGTRSMSLMSLGVKSTAG